MRFRPKIIGFVCNWSLPPGVDVASPSRIAGHPKIRIVRVVCVGRIDPAIMLETFVKGADGVLMVGCPQPDCHYVTGNSQAEWRVRMLKKLMSRTDLEPERLRLDWSYPFEIERFAKIINDFRNQILALGPSPLVGETPDTRVLLNVKAAKVAIEDFRLRALFSKEQELAEKKNVWGEELSQETLDARIEADIEAQYLRSKACLLLKDSPMSVTQLSKHLDIKPDETLRHIVVMRQEGLVAISEVKGTTPFYTALGEAQT